MVFHEPDGIENETHNTLQSKPAHFRVHIQVCFANVL
jgi:hypothetical protein